MNGERKRARPRGRDYGARVDRQKARLMWLVEDMGVDKFRQIVGEYMGGVTLRTGVHPKARPAGDSQDQLLSGQQPGDGGLVWCRVNRRRPRRAALEHRLPAALWSASPPSRLPPPALARGDIHPSMPLILIVSRCTHRRMRSLPPAPRRSTTTCGSGAMCSACTPRSRPASCGWAPACRPGACSPRTCASSRASPKSARPPAPPRASHCGHRARPHAAHKRGACAGCTSVTATCGAACRLG